MLRFSIFGIPVQIELWFWLSLGFIGVLSFDPTDGTQMTALLLFVLAGFISIMVHELGHALTGRLFGAPTAITLHAFGGFATFPGNAFNRGQDFMVTAAGPTVQFVFGIGVWLFSLLLPDLPYNANFFFTFLIWISIVWAVINLIPVLPLDGGRLVNAMLGPARQELTLKVSIATAIIVGLGLFLLTGSIIAPIFLGFMAHQNWQQLKIFQSRRF